MIELCCFFSALRLSSIVAAVVVAIVAIAVGCCYCSCQLWRLNFVTPNRTKVDIITYNAAVAACKVAGRWEVGLDLFREIQEKQAGFC